MKRWSRYYEDRDSYYWHANMGTKMVHSDPRYEGVWAAVYANCIAKGQAVDLAIIEADFALDELLDHMYEKRNI